MTRKQMMAEADQLDAQAEVNDAYRTAMERTTERTNGRLGHLNNPTSYAAHGKAAADKRKRAADLRAAAAGSPREMPEVQVPVEAPRPAVRWAGEGRQGVCRRWPARRGCAEAGMEDAQEAGEA